MLYFGAGFAYGLRSSLLRVVLALRVVGKSISYQFIYNWMALSLLFIKTEHVVYLINKFELILPMGNDLCYLERTGHDMIY